jgi:hypothetical protein
MKKIYSYYVLDYSRHITDSLNSTSYLEDVKFFDRRISFTEKLTTKQIKTILSNDQSIAIMGTTRKLQCKFSHDVDVVDLEDLEGYEAKQDAKDIVKFLTFVSSFAPKSRYINMLLLKFSSYT